VGSRIPDADKLFPSRLPPSSGVAVLVAARSPSVSGQRLLLSCRLGERDMRFNEVSHNRGLPKRALPEMGSPPCPGCKPKPTSRSFAERSRHKAANWVGRVRGRKSTRPGAHGVVELTPHRVPRPPRRSRPAAAEVPAPRARGVRPESQAQAGGHVAGKREHQQATRRHGRRA